MKKKLIEALEPAKRPKGKKGTIAVVRIPVKGLLTIDILEGKNVQMRICVTKTEFANYYPATGVWDNKQATSDICDRWMEKENVVGWKKIEEVLGVKVEGYPLQEVGWYERNIEQRKREQTEQRKLEACRQRNATLPEVTDREKEWLAHYVDAFHYLIYKRHGRYVDVACSSCGQTGTFLMKPVTLEDFARPIMLDIPKHNEHGACPFCKVRVQYKAEGRFSKYELKEDHKYILYPDGNGSVVIRYFAVWKRSGGTTRCAWENEDMWESARVWNLEKGQQVDWHKSDWFGHESWDYKNLAGMANLTMRAGKTYQGNLDFLKDTDMKYACIPEALLNNDYENMENYIGAYRKYPILEMLTKLGMTNMRAYILDRWRWDDKLDPNGKTPAAIFKITKQRFADMRKRNGNAELLELFQLEKEIGNTFQEAEVKAVNQLRLSYADMQMVFQYAKPVKLMNYIEKKMSVVGADYFGRTDKLNETVAMYVDYIRMCVINDRDMTDPHKVYPAELEAAHDREYVRMNKNRSEAEKKEKNRKNPNIKKDAAGYNRQYRYQNEKYIIRAPKDAAEILEEGLTLDHCVGRMGYIEAMNRHEKVILFLRKKKTKNTPYYTLEVKNGTIKQAYGKSDKKPDWEEVGPFLEAFKQAKLEKKEERQAG